MPKKETKTETETKTKVKPKKRAPARAAAKRSAPKRAKKVAPVAAPQSDSLVAEQCFARWTGKDYVRTENETLLYQLSAVGSVAMIFWSYREGSVLSILTFVLLLLVVASELRSAARDIAYEINLDGVVIDGRLYRFETIRSFEVTKKGEFDVIKLQLKTTLFPVRELHLAAEQDVLFIKNLLRYFLLEERQQETLVSFRNKRELTEKEYIDEKVDELLKRKP